MHRLVRVRREPSQGCRDVRGLRVVHVADTADLSDRLQAVWNARERARGLVAIASSSIPAARAAAVAAAAFSRLWAPRISGSAGSGSSAENSIPSRPSPRGTTAMPGPFEDPQLGGTVGLEAAVAVEVIGLEIQHDRYLARERVDVLELERGHLAHDPVGRLDRAERRADVSGDGHVPSCRPEDRAEKLGGRRLAVRPGHADEASAARGEQAPAELDLGPDGDPAAPRLLDERALAGHPGRLDEELDTVEEREVVSRCRASRRSRRRRRRATRAGPPGREPRAREPVDERPSRADVRVVLVEEREAARRRGSRR